MKHLTKNLVFVLVLQCLLARSEKVAETVVKIGEKLLKEDSILEDANSLPGHLRPLGYGSVVQPIPVFNGFPKPAVFLGEYVVAESPVVCQRGALWLGQAFSTWNEQTWSTSGFGLTTLVDVTKSSSSTSEIMSLRNFSRILKTEDAAIEMPVPADLLRLTLVPRSLLCDALSSQILDVVMRFHVGAESTPLKSSTHDIMLCQLGGARKLTLINPMTVPNKTAVLDQDGGLSSSVDVNKVDMNKYGSLSEAEILVTHMKPSDCIYIPAKWLYSSRTYERDISFSIVWNHKPTVPSQQACGPKVPKQLNKTLADLVLLNRPVTATLTPSTNFTYLHYFVDHYFRPTVAVSLVDFESLLLLDTGLFGQSLGLDLELKTIEAEIFSLLDLNKDGNLSNLDLDTADIETLKAVSGVLDAAVLKLSALLEKQQAAAATTATSGAGTTATPGATAEQVPAATETAAPVDEGTKILVETYGNELKRILEESLQELIQQDKGSTSNSQNHKVLEEKAKSKLRKFIKTKKQQKQPAAEDVVEEVVPEEEMTSDNQEPPVEEELPVQQQKKSKVFKQERRSAGKQSKESAVEPEVQPEQEIGVEEVLTEQKASKKQKDNKNKGQNKQKGKKADKVSEHAASSQEEVVDVGQEQPADQQSSKNKKNKGQKYASTKDQGKNGKDRNKNGEQATEQGGNVGKKSGKYSDKQNENTGKHGGNNERQNVNEGKYGKKENKNKGQTGKNKNGGSEQYGKKGKKDGGQNKEQKKNKNRVEL